MQIIRIHIVALPYYDVSECLDEFLAEAQGRVMTLRPDPANDYDVNAVCAYDWQGRHVGYVASHDLKETWQTLRGSGRKSLRGHVVEVNSEHKCVVFECHVETLGEVGELYPTASYQAWKYTGPMLKLTAEMASLDYMMDEINERLDEYEDWSEEDGEDFETLTERFCQMSRYDLSGEMSDFRRRLCLKLIDIAGSRFDGLVENLKMAFGRTGREVHGGEVLYYWMHIISEPKTIKPLLACRHEYDVEKVRRELEAFPESMFERWLENKEHFMARLLYMHIPRRVLWQLVSGIAFYEAVKTRELVQNDEYEILVERILQLPTVELQYEAYQQITALLTGTAWDEKAAEVLEKMFAKVKEQKDRQHKMDEAVKKSLEEPRTQNFYGDKNEFQDGGQMLKMVIPQGTDPAKIAARIAEQQQALLKQKEN